jgi:polysaccharide export outer membrane protein
MRDYTFPTVILPCLVATFFVGFASQLGQADDHKERQEIAPEQPVVPSTKYVIGPGDILTINVWKEPEASVLAAAVRPDGMISVPIVKDVQAAGLTPLELQAVLAEKFARFFKGADVSVIVKEIHSQRVYVIGAVKKEGPIDMKAPLTVLQAVAEAGGLNDYAKRSKIYILRKSDRKEVRLPFDYSAVIKGSHAEQNVTLQVGDTVVIPQ